MHRKSDGTALSMTCSTEHWGRIELCARWRCKKHTCARDAAALASGSNSAKSSSMGAPSCCRTASCTSSKSRGSALSCKTSSLLQGVMMY